MSLFWLLKYLPVKHFIFLNEYFYLSDKINIGQVPFKVILFYVIFTIKMINFIPMFQENNILTKLIIFDYFYVYNLTRDFGVLFLSIFQQSSYFYYVMYFVASKNLMVINPKTMLLNLKNDLFLENHIFRISVNEFIQNSTLVMLNMMMGLVITLGNVSKFVFILKFNFFICF